MLIVLSDITYSAAGQKSTANSSEMALKGAKQMVHKVSGGVFARKGDSVLS